MTNKRSHDLECNDFCNNFAIYLRLTIWENTVTSVSGFLQGQGHIDILLLLESNYMCMPQYQNQATAINTINDQLQLRVWGNQGKSLTNWRNNNPSKTSKIWKNPKPTDPSILKWTFLLWIMVFNSLDHQTCLFFYKDNVHPQDCISISLSEKKYWLNFL